MSQSTNSSAPCWVIAIDGPAGAGKSTTAKALAKDLGLRYLDTGAMYRALALKASRTGIKGHEGEEAARLLETTEIGFGSGDPQPVFLDREDVTALIRTHEIGDLASALSAHPPVRRALVARQQAMVAQGGVILEGRDATTVIAPRADVKVYLTASLEERSRRRFVEFGDTGMDSTFEAVRAQIEIRDHRDITREDSPLSVAPDAVVVESGLRTVDAVVADIKALLPKSK
jgi:cytidylate kinase